MAKKIRATRQAEGAEATEATEATEALDRAMAELLASISAGDVLDAEMQVSSLIALSLAGGTEAEHSVLTVALIDAAEARANEPEAAAAFLRLLMALGPRAVKRRASEALADLTGDGIYPPEWVNDIGKPAPGQAYRGRDRFGDREAVLVTFSYADAEHALLVLLDLAELPMVSSVSLSTDVPRLMKLFEDDDDEFFERLEPVALSEARRRIEVPLAQAGQDPDIDLETTTLLALPLARSRVRRLPAPEPGQAVSYTAADRAGAVTDFLHSPEAADAGDPDVARFWAQALTGYSSRVADEPPAQPGRHKLSAALLVYVAGTFTLSAAQLDGMRPAVTAWTRWAARRQDLGEAATETLMTHLAPLLNELPAAYDDPDNVAARAYVRDIAVPDTDAAWLADCRARRELAAPRPENRDPDDADVDPADPDGRALLVESEFGTCDLEGADPDEFLATARRVVEELWHDDPPGTWQAAKGLLARGHDPHDVIHLLVAPRGK